MVRKVFILFLSTLVVPIQFGIPVLGLVEQLNKLVVLLV